MQCELIIKFLNKYQRQRFRERLLLPGRFLLFWPKKNLKAGNGFSFLCEEKNTFSFSGTLLKNQINKNKNIKIAFTRSPRIKPCWLSFFGKTEYFTSFNVK